MTFIKKYGTLIFIAILLVHCLFIYTDMAQGRMVTKLLLLPFLLLYLFASRAGIVPPLVILGLICSFAGDALLTQSGELFFILGMVAFICTHICNSVFFYRLQKGGGDVVSYLLVAALFLSALSAIVFLVLQSTLGNLKAPILVYMLIISIMAVLATSTVRNSWVRSIAIRCFIPGAVLFVLSDTLLALNKFLWHQQMSDIAVMATYGAAQYFLVRGFIKMTELKA